MNVTARMEDFDVESVKSAYDRVTILTALVLQGEDLMREFLDAYTDYSLKLGGAACKYGMSGVSIHFDTKMVSGASAESPSPPMTPKEVELEACMHLAKSKIEGDTINTAALAMQIVELAG